MTAPVSPRPRILVAVTHPMTANLLMRGQLRDLAERGFHMAVLASPGPDLDEVARREGVEALPVPLRRQPAPVADLLALPRIAAAIHRFRPHLVNAGTPKAGLLVGLAARGLRVPRRLYTLRGLPLETARGMRRRLLTATERTAAACAHRVIYVGESLRRRSVELGLAPAAKTRLLGDGASNGVDTDRFRPSPEASGPLRRALGIPAGAPVVGFVGRFTRDKGIEDLAAAFFGDLSERFPESRLLLVGGFEAGDPVAPEVRARLEEDPRVIRPGFVADPAPYYGAMDVLAFPSHREGFPNAPLEAAASGLPVVGFRATGTVDAVADGETGTLVPLADREALAAALAGYIGEPERAEEHGEAGRRRVVERFRCQRVWQAWADLYAGELATAGLPAPTIPEHGERR